MKLNKKCLPRWLNTIFNVIPCRFVRLLFTQMILIVTLLMNICTWFGISILNASMSFLDMICIWGRDSWHSMDAAWGWNDPSLWEKEK